MFRFSTTPDTLKQIVDVSKWNCRPLGGDYWEVDWDWEKVKAGVQLMIIRTNDGLYQDPVATRLIDGCKVHQIPWGVYMYWRSRSTPEQQALLCWAIVGQTPPKGVWLDLEEPSPALAGDQMFRHIDETLHLLDEKFQCMTGVYSRKSWMDEKISRELQREWKHREGWWAHYGVDKPAIPAGWDSYLLHQFQNDGRIDGMGDRNVDLSCINRSRYYYDVKPGRYPMTHSFITMLVDDPTTEAKLMQHLNDMWVDYNLRHDIYPYGPPAGSPPPPPPPPAPEHTLRDQTNQQVINLFYRTFGPDTYISKISVALDNESEVFGQRTSLYTGLSVERMHLDDADKAKLIAELG